MIVELPAEWQKRIAEYQRNEITEHHIYQRLGETIISPENRKILQDIAADELHHYQVWKKYTGRDIEPSVLRFWRHYWVSKIFGLTFGVKLMERGEEKAEKTYRQLEERIPEAETIWRDEQAHELKLINLLDEERLRYAGSIVLGLNDALVELTGGLAGLTLALRNTRLVALSGLIVGIAAALSMGASAYLSGRTDDRKAQPLKSALYTGITYVVTVVLLIIPYLILSSPYACLAWTLIMAVIIIAGFNYYLSVAKDIPFRKLFLEMAGISLGVAGISFAVGYLLRMTLGVDI
ncbi:MAG: VIT1/CCC1 transporter family protein [Candidatus Omnitrophica bacterium]|nr:VIT1/CCC1 transporter family protein [Candidatus Omnitrophota bacterium]